MTEDDKYYTELMTSTAGPKKHKILGEVEEEDEATEEAKAVEMVTYSLKGEEVTMEGEGQEYSVKHKGERFALGNRADLSKLGSVMKGTKDKEEEEEERKRNEEEETKRKESEAAFFQ